VAPLCARCAHLFDTAALPLTAWIRSELGGLARRHGIEVVELLATCENNPNALARHRFCDRAIELWETSGCQDVIEAAAGRLLLDQRTRLPFLRLPGSSQDLAVFSFAAANVAAGDPVAKALLRTGFRDAPQTNFRASLFCYEREIREPRFAPRLRLNDGSVVRGRRTVVPAERLRSCSRSSGAERFAFWAGLARQYNWPALVNARRGHGPSLLVARDSPIAVEALFHGIGEEPSPLIVEEFPGTPWLVNSTGGHHTIELAVPFVRSEHAWSIRQEES
jgi:hypothetical protein